MAVDKNKKKAMDAEITEALLDDFDKFEHFATNYWKQIIAVAVVIVIAVALWVMISDAKTKADRKAIDILTNAKTENEILNVVDEYSSYPAANYARLRLAKMYLKDKKYSEAYEQFNILRSSNIPREMAWRISLDEGYAMELEGKKEAAAAKFAELGTNPSLPEGLRCEANYSAGRIYSELNKNDLAEKYLSKASKAAESQATYLWTTQAKFMLVRLPEKNIAPQKPEKISEPQK
jgi:hypothetical protein